MAAVNIAVSENESGRQNWDCICQLLENSFAKGVGMAGKPCGGGEGASSEPASVNQGISLAVCVYVACVWCVCVCLCVFLWYPCHGTCIEVSLKELVLILHLVFGQRFSCFSDALWTPGLLAS